MSEHTPEPWRIDYEAKNESSWSLQGADGSRVAAFRYNWCKQDAINHAECDAADLTTASAISEALLPFLKD